MFQSLYTAAPSFAPLALTSLEYWVRITLPLLALLVWAFRCSQRNLRRVIAAFLNETAKEMGILADVETLGARRRGSRLAGEEPAAR